MNIFRCGHRGHLLSFENSQCVRCGYRLAYLPDVGQMASFESLADGRCTLPPPVGRALVPPVRELRASTTSATGPSPPTTRTLCRSCRLTEMIPDLDAAGTQEAWYRWRSPSGACSTALLALGLPVASKTEIPSTAWRSSSWPTRARAQRRCSPATRRRDHHQRRRGRRRRAREAPRRSCASPTARCSATSATRSATTTGTG